MAISINIPFTEEEICKLKVGDKVLISGTIYTARDAAHKRLIELLDRNKDLPIEIKNQIIYYVGPTPAKPDKIIGSAGPTTSYRMDSYTPKLLDMGLKGMIGKGLRSKEVVESIVKNKAIYFGAIGGAAALISKCIKKSEIIAYEDLGSEAIRKLQVENFPAIVVIDSLGNNLYEYGQEEYLKYTKMV
ncbi:fumarate hydratase class I, anaerobic [Clostridium pasteurianum DSM 525 = ATCC 6013]|uniref:Fumarate hydratase class I, anaerobic n=1 Tax=Clostridium pasteurianum DSM 525 = ATCC 6013 TaxID=1262449 RepID=A0A0H3JBG5_CLOPA|nr:Fe-S-containing hydro-lyase [Clostridium pasteurianum]AJA49690.1 fumarate hydratase class I, anaerobic [Clostridium pasteurianum DSM 525 = ATCC 6013]AJA53678.1 fumarate hydratase class I, anaerobic [Clostridium pasteurianum DSM 525 = ATCC 6013]AOZ76840.1 fumarate hydratase [Clostridium pasteurianum DSM 525 = ATCC 6013]AOZ80637.1 fumarate hydratase [Clostridium pasteurianum]ELP57620.1 hydro-lyase, Fe-S type, tartrate/fumarate subfamily, beta region [Clostridium pasteurianum DSM 525 = ATCC 60